MKTLRSLLLFGLLFCLAGLVSPLSAQTQAVDPTVDPAWTIGQRNVPFAFDYLSGSLLVTTGSKPVRSSPSVASSAVILSLTTSATGASFVTFSSQTCDALDLVNASTATIEYRRNGAGAAMPIPAGSSRLILGITNANQIGIRRLDTSNTQVSIAAEAISL